MESKKKIFDALAYFLVISMDHNFYVKIKKNTRIFISKKGGFSKDKFDKIIKPF